MIEGTGAIVGEAVSPGARGRGSGAGDLWLAALAGGWGMRTNIAIDDKLMRDTLRATGLKTKREALDEALRTLLRLRKQAGIRRLRGKLD